MASIPEGFEAVDNDIPEGFEAIDTGFPGAGFVEPTLAIGSILAASAAGGVAGIGTGAVVGGLNLLGIGEEVDPAEASAEVSKQIQSDFSFTPRTEEGKKGLQTINEFAKLLNVPAAGLSGLVKAAGGGSLEDIVATIDRVKEGGVGPEVGDQVLESTGSPALATLADLLSSGASDIATGGAVLGASRKALGGARQATTAIAPQVGEVVKQTGKQIVPVIKAGKELVSDVSKFKTPATREIARQLKAGDINTDVALFKLADEGITNPTIRQKLLGADLPKVVKDTPTVKAARQGINEEFLEVVKKAGTTADKKALIRMTDIAKKGRTNPVFRSESRPSFVAGDVLLDKVNAIKRINRAAGKRIGNATKFLKGKQVPVAEIGDKFLSSLDDLKIAIKPDGKLDFKDALISGAGRKKAIADIFDRMSRNKNPDALDLHHLKQFIDDTVSYGKTVRGLGGKAENALKELRTNIKDTLNSNFPQYAKANEAYSDTISLLDKIQELAGKKTDLTSDSAAGDLAVLARRITSNAQSRGRVRDAFLDLDKLLDKHSGFTGVKRLPGKGDGKVDFNLLMNYADELDKVTGSSATTAFTGSIETAIKATRGPKEFLAEKATEAARKAAGISEKGAFESMSEFLKSELKKKPQK